MWNIIKASIRPGFIIVSIFNSILFFYFLFGSNVHHRDGHLLSDELIYVLVNIGFSILFTFVGVIWIAAARNRLIPLFAILINAVVIVVIFISIIRSL